MTGPHERWLERAEDDLKFARVGLKEGFYSQVCFLSQQAVEKSLKAFLISRGVLYPKTHKLTDLAEACSKLDRRIERFNKDFRILDEFYIPTRYPDAIPGSLKGFSPSKKRAEEALEMAEKIKAFIEAAIS